MKKVFLLIMLILSGCYIDVPTGTVIFDEIVQYQPPVEENSFEIVTFTCPEDSCADHLVGYINEAEDIKCAFFDLDLPEVIKALEQKDAKVVVDNNNKDDLEESGYLSNVRYDTSSQLSHNKFCVFDKRIVWTGSMNPTFNGDQKNDNDVFVIHSTYLAQNYLDEFEELWAGQYGKGARVRYPKILLNGQFIENYFCPDDCKEARGDIQGGEKRLVELIDTANESVEVMIYTFTLDSVADALIRARDRGVNVTVLMEARQRNVKGSVYQKLVDAGIDVTLDTNPAIMHHKMVIIDGRIIWTGSFNFSRNAGERNDENILVIIRS